MSKFGAIIFFGAIAAIFVIATRRGQDSLGTNSRLKSFPYLVIRNLLVSSAVLFAYSAGEYWAAGSKVLSSGEFINTMWSLGIIFLICALASARAELTKAEKTSMRGGPEKRINE